MLESGKVPTTGQRNKAAKLRGQVKNHENVDPDDLAWLLDYERKEQERVGKIEDAAARAGVKGASRRRKVTHVEEEEERAGTGDAAIAAVAAAAETREEGRRLDTLIGLGHQALLGAVEAYKSMTAQVLERNHQLERAHIRMMETVRVHFLARVNAEGEAEDLARELETRPDEEKRDALTRMADELIPMLMPAIAEKLTAAADALPATEGGATAKGKGPEKA
jgi:hypothetical protein